MEDVRLTVQIRSKNNDTRVTLHRDVQLNDAATKAREITEGAAKFFRKEKKAAAAAAD